VIKISGVQLYLLTYFDLPRSPSLQFGQVQATRLNLVFVTELEAGCWPPELASEDAKTGKKYLGLLYK
jgi:hypothetical protein